MRSTFHQKSLFCHTRNIITLTMMMEVEHLQGYRRTFTRFLDSTVEHGYSIGKTIKSFYILACSISQSQGITESSMGFIQHSLNSGKRRQQCPYNYDLHKEHNLCDDHSRLAHARHMRPIDFVEGLSIVHKK